jgi:predicted RNA-binding Zn-ribbon protein involved in translation (DUF1610 family)
MDAVRTPPVITRIEGSAAARLRCFLGGHVVDNGAFRKLDRSCQRCGLPFLRDTSQPIRIGHTLSCFFRHHTYERVGTRDGHHEYACVRCGHPLLFRADADPYDGLPRFFKRVRYLCSLFGHHVHVVAIRSGGVEYACGCGHSFIQREIGRRRVTHPLKCFFLGHWVRFVERRGDLSEYGCRTCGHPFLFAGSPTEARSEMLPWSRSLRRGKTSPRPG